MFDDISRDHFEEQGYKPNLQHTANTDHKRHVQTIQKQNMDGYVSVEMKSK